MAVNKVIIIVAIYVVFTTGALAFFLNRAFQGRGMNKTIEQLEDQIILLLEETEQLKGEIDQLELQVSLFRQILSHYYLTSYTNKIHIFLRIMIHSID